MFALRDGPPRRIAMCGGEYRLVRVFKHDFWAATCLYELEDELEGEPSGTAPSPTPRIVVKFARREGFFGLPLDLCGQWLIAREETIYNLLAGIDGVPDLLGRVGPNGLAIEYIEGRPLDHLSEIPPALFDRLGEVFAQIHARGVAYCDANKRSNILVTDDGRPFVIDYQIAIARRDNWPWPLRGIVAAVVAYLAERDIYHLHKHKRRLTPERLRPEEEALSRSLSGLHRLHRKLTKPYRALRRRFLQYQYAKGALKSPTEDLEDHDQPEKRTWRKRDRP